MQTKHLLTIGFLIIMALPATALAGGDGPPCDTPITIQANLPDGDVTFSATNNNTVVVIVKHWYESGDYYSAASTTLKLRPGVTAQKGEHFVVLHAEGKAHTLTGSPGFETLVKHADVSGVVTHILDEGHVGFRVDLKWDYVTEKGTKPRHHSSLARHRVTLRDPAPLGYPMPGITARTQQSDRTSVRDGFQWYQSPLVAANVDWKATTANVLRCNVTPRVVSRTANPPLTGPKRHAKR